MQTIQAKLMRAEQDLTGPVSVELDAGAGPFAQWWGTVRAPLGVSLPIGPCRLVLSNSLSFPIIIERKLDDCRSFFLGLGPVPQV